MPRSKKVSNYPPVLGKVLDEVLDSGREYRLPFGTSREAYRLRNQLYSYIIALDTQEEAELVPRALRLSNKYRQVKISVEGAGDGEGACVVLIDRNKTPEIVMLEQLLEQARNAQGEAPGEATEDPWTRHSEAEAEAKGDGDPMNDLVKKMFGGKGDA